jgi:SPP1 gp7 family putative phage head morphogenesis protein
MTLRDQDDFVSNITNARKSGVITWGYTDESNLRQALYLPEIELEVWKKANNTKTEYLPAAQAGAPGAPGAGTPPMPGAGPAPGPDGTLPTPPGTADLKAMLGMSAKVENFSDKETFASKSDRIKFQPVLLKTKADWDIVPSDLKVEKMSAKTRRASPRIKSKFEKRTDFAAIKKSMDTLENIGIRWFSKIMAGVGQDVNEFVKSKKLLEDHKRQKEILDFTFSEQPLKRLFANLMIAEYLAGKIQVVERMRKNGAKIPIKFSDLDRIDEVFDDYDPNDADLDMNDIVDVVKMRGGTTSIPFQKGELARIKDKFTVKAYAIAGENRTKVLSTVQRMLQKAVDEGWSYDTWKGNLEDSLGDYAGTVFGNYGDGDMDSATHAKTTFRTIMNDTMNDGAYEAMRDESLGVRVVGYQISAILDTATTDICRAADGLYFKMDNPLAEIPAFHYNCRSIILEVLEEDDDGSIEWADKLPIPPMKGFSKHDFCAHTMKFSDTNVSTKNFTFESLKEPVAIYCHVDDMDGLLGGVSMQRLAWVIFGKVVPVIPMTYGNSKLINPKDPCWTIDLDLHNHAIADNPDCFIVDHHIWEDVPAGSYWIDGTETMSAAGMACRLFNEAIESGCGVMTNVRGMMISKNLYETVEVGDCWKDADPRFELSRDIQYFMTTIGFDAMWVRFANNIENILIAPELPYMHEKRVKDEMEQVANARQHLIPVSWGSIVDSPAGSFVATIIAKETNKPVAYIKASGVGSCVCFKSSNGEAIKLSKSLGGGGHANSAGAYIDAPKAVAIKKLQEVQYEDLS